MACFLTRVPPVPLNGRGFLLRQAQWGRNEKSRRGGILDQADFGQGSGVPPDSGKTVLCSRCCPGNCRNLLGSGRLGEKPPGRNRLLWCTVQEERPPSKRLRLFISPSNSSLFLKGRKNHQGKGTAEAVPFLLLVWMALFRSRRAARAAARGLHCSGFR
jgi:hypothetical protein